MEVLYGAMSNGSRLLTVREFLHCYRLDEIDKSRGMYSFVPRKSVLKVIYETPDSNRDWSSDVCSFDLVYEQALKAGLRFPLNRLK